MQRKISLVIVSVLLASIALGCGAVSTLLEKGVENLEDFEPPVDIEDLESLPIPDLEDLGNLDLEEGGIPEGYPESVVPIYEPANSTIMGGSKMQLGDNTAYTVVVGSEKDVDTVSSTIRAHFENAADNFEDMGMAGAGMFAGSIGEWNFVITIHEGSDEDGHATLITYTVTQEQSTD